MLITWVMLSGTTNHQRRHQETCTHTTEHKGWAHIFTQTNRHRRMSLWVCMYVWWVKLKTEWYTLWMYIIIYMYSKYSLCVWMLLCGESSKHSLHFYIIFIVIVAFMYTFISIIIIIINIIYMYITRKNIKQSEARWK